MIAARGQSLLARRRRLDVIAPQRADVVDVLADYDCAADAGGHGPLEVNFLGLDPVRRGGEPNQAAAAVAARLGAAGVDEIAVGGRRLDVGEAALAGVVIAPQELAALG